MSGSVQPIARIWKNNRTLTWHAELWTPNIPNQVRLPLYKTLIEKIAAPPPIEGYTHIATSFRETRWGARRAARKMKRRYLAERTPLKQDEPPVVEIVS